MHAAHARPECGDTHTQRSWRTLAHTGAQSAGPGGPAHFMAFMGAAAFIALARVFTSFFRRMAFMGAAAFIALARVFTSFFRRMAFMGAAAFIAFAMTREGGG